jgi:hypothetical protein
MQRLLGVAVALVIFASVVTALWSTGAADRPARVRSDEGLG